LLGRRGQIIVKKAGFAGWTASIRHSPNPDNPHDLFLGKGKRVARTHGLRCLRDTLRIDAHMATGNNRSSTTSGLEKARMPQPFVQAPP
jgi:hypothetical protein